MEDDFFGKAFGSFIVLWIVAALASIGLTVAIIWGIVMLVLHFT
jgi:hypothetical protein